MSIDLFSLQKELEYFCGYYGTNFIKGLGAEDILNCFDKYSVKSKWLDLGGGSTSLLWWLSQKFYNPIDIVDISEESFMLTKILKNSNYNKGCYDYVRKYYYDKDYKYCKIKFIKQDLLNSFSIEKKYKNVSQIGLLGLCKDKNQFKYILKRICDLLKNDGILISANWIFNDSYAKQKKIYNNYINQKLIENFVKDNELTLNECKYIKFNNDKNYEGVLIYVIQKKNNVAKHR